MTPDDDSFYFNVDPKRIIFRTMFGDHGTVSMEKKSTIGSSLMLTFGGVMVPVGYTRSVRKRILCGIVRE